MREELKQDLERIKAAGQLRDLADSVSLIPGKVETRGRSYTDFTNWDYFNLAVDPRIKRAAQEEIEKVGLGPRATRTSSGTSPLHSQCERHFARFIGAESALLFSTKTQAIFTFITTFCTEQDWIIVDETVQSPVLDAGYLVNATTSSLSFTDTSKLSLELERAQGARRKFVFIESTSPSTGRTAPIKDIQAICRRSGAQLLIDESVSLGICGSRGAGMLETANLSAAADVLAVFSDFSMGLSSFGAALAAPELIISQLVNRSRTLTHEIALPSLLTATTIATLEIVELMAAQRLLLLQRTQEFENGLALIEKRMVSAVSSPILSIHFSSYPLALECIKALGSKGVFADAINLRLPLSEKSVVRFIVNSAHTSEQIELTLNHLNDILPRMQRRKS